MNIASHIKKLRISKQLTQGKMAHLLSVSRYTYCQWEQGRWIPSLIHFIRLYKLANLPMNWWLGEELDD